MKDNQTLHTDFEALCLQQKETITRQQVQIWDLEEEIRVLNRQIERMEADADKAQEKIDKFELWCDHQQTLINAMDIDKMKMSEALEYFKKLASDLEERCRGLEKGLIYRVLRKIKRILSK